MNFPGKGSCLAQGEASRKNNELTNDKNADQKQTSSDHVEGMILEDVRQKRQEYEEDTITPEMLQRDDIQYGEKNTEKDILRKTILLDDSIREKVEDIDEGQASGDEHSKKTTDVKNLESVCDVKNSNSEKMNGEKNLKDFSFGRELESHKLSKHGIEKPKHSNQCLNQRCVVSNRGPYKKPHKCDQCETSFRTPYELKRHGRIHSGERPFKCQLCDMSFKRKDHVEVHIRRHIEDRRHVCDLCGMWFVTSSCLLRHRRRTHQVFDPPSQIKHTHWPGKIPVTYPGGARWGEPEENLPFSPSDSVPLREQRRKRKSKIKHDRTYRPGSKTVCILKKRKLRNKSYSFVELEDDVECFESDEGDNVPCLKVQDREQAVKQEDEELITEVSELEHSLFPISFLSHAASLDQLLPMGEVSRLISDKYVDDLREGQLEDSCVSESTKKDEYSTKLQTEESNCDSEDEDSEVPLISCDVSFDEPENESIISSNDIDREKTCSSDDILKDINDIDSEKTRSSDDILKDINDIDSEKTRSSDDILKDINDTDSEKTHSSDDILKDINDIDSEKTHSSDDILKDINDIDSEKTRSSDDILKDINDIDSEKTHSSNDIVKDINDIDSEKTRSSDDILKDINDIDSEKTRSSDDILKDINDIDSEKTRSSDDILKDIKGNQNDFSMEALNEPLKRNIFENNCSKILSEVDIGPSTDSLNNDKSKKLKEKVKEEREVERVEPYNQIWKKIHQSLGERNPGGSSDISEDQGNTPGLSENHHISHQSYSTIASSRCVWQNAILKKKNSKDDSFPPVQIVKEDPEKIETGYKKPHKCHSCDLYFRSPSELERHTRIHSGERPFLCELCGSGFIRKCHLQLHMRRHTGERRHACRECGMMLFTTSDLNRHMLIHKTNKPFKCHICTLTFRRVSHLEQHIRRHSDATPFTCKLCGTFFTTAASLKKHEKHHFSRDPYSCPECSASFSTATSLSKHQRVHIDPQLSVLKTTKLHFEGMKKSDQYECVSSDGSPLSLVIRRVAARTRLKIPGLLRPASEKLDSLDAVIDDTSQETTSGWESEDFFCRNKSVLSCEDLSFVKNQARNAGVLYSIKQEISSKKNNGFYENGNHMADGDYAYVVEESTIRNVFKLHIKDKKPLDSKLDDAVILGDCKKEKVSKISKSGKICSMIKNTQSPDRQVGKYDNEKGSHTDKSPEHITKTITLNLLPASSNDLNLLNSCLQQNIRDAANTSSINSGKKLMPAKGNFHSLDSLDEKYNGDIDVKHSGDIIRKKPAVINPKEVDTDKVNLDPLGELKRSIHSIKTINSYKAIEKVDEMNNKDIAVYSVSQKKTTLVAVSDEEYLGKKDEVHRNIIRSCLSPNQTRNMSDSYGDPHVETEIVNQDMIGNISEKISEQALCVQAIKNRYLDISKLKTKYENENAISVHDYSPLLAKASTTVAEVGHKSKKSACLQEGSESIELFDQGVVPACSVLPCASQKLSNPEPIPTSVFSDTEQGGVIPKPNPMNPVTGFMRHDRVGEDSPAVCHKEKQEDVKSKLCSPSSVSSDEQKGIFKQNPTTISPSPIGEGQGATPIQTVLSTVLSHEKQEKLQSEKRHLSFVPSDKQQKEIRSPPSYIDHQKCDDPVTICPGLPNKIKGDHRSEITSKKQEHVPDSSAEQQKKLRQMTVDPILISKDVGRDPIHTDSVLLRTGQEKDARDGPSIPECIPSRITNLRINKVYSEGSHIPYSKKAHQVAITQTNRETCRNSRLKFQISNILS